MMWQGLDTLEQMNMRSKKTLSFLLTVSIVVMNLAFFYLFAIDLKGVFLALTYFVTAVFLPGLLIAALVCQGGAHPSTERPTGHLFLSLATVFGFANMLVSYLLGQAFHQAAYNYLFAWAYLLVLVGPARTSLKSLLAPGTKSEATRHPWQVPAILAFILVLNILFFLVRPTPGLVPLDIFHDHVWNAGNTVSMTSHYPLQSMNIEQRPYIAYHVLIYILGAHMALTTGLISHLVGLQFVFVPLMPLLVISLAAFLRQFLRRKDIYLYYGLAVLLFGGGFAMVHEVKVRSYLGSSTNFLGIILLFSVLALVMNAHHLSAVGRFVSFSVGLFLSTAAKGSIGASLAAGAVLWTAYRIWKKKLTPSDTADCLGALTGFAAAFLAFFVLPVLGQPVFREGAGRAALPLVPLSYITKNELAAPFIEMIYRYLPGHFQVLAHVVATTIMLPLFVVLYFSYRLIAVRDFKATALEEPHQRVVLVALGSFMMAFGLNAAPMDNAYFATSGLLILDAFFVRHVGKENLFSQIRSSCGARQAYPFLGAILVAALPFLSSGGWVRSEYIYNAIMDGRLGRMMDERLSKTAYRQNHRSITPKMYEAFSFIRKNTREDSIIVTPFVEEPDGRHLAYYTSAFSERTAFIEGYEFAGIAKEGLVKYVGSEGIGGRKAALEDIYTRHSIPETMRNGKYLFLVDTATRNGLEGKYGLRILYGNEQWSVLQLAAKR